MLHQWLEHEYLSYCARVGILRKVTGSKWGRVYRFEEYFKVFE